MVLHFPGTEDEFELCIRENKMLLVFLRLLQVDAYNYLLARSSRAQKARRCLVAMLLH